MIQEKDFLYRVPVKTAPITTPGGQIRNPEILVDVEGGEFMHGNILDANSTNKLINQSVKDAVDNKLIESGYVTKDLLEAETTRATEQENSLKTLIGSETSARTKGDEDLSSKIKAEQTRAEGKEKEISDKLAIVDGDSNTEGSFRKAIADLNIGEYATQSDLSAQLGPKADRSDLLTLENKVTANAAALKGKQDKGDYVRYSTYDDDGYYFHDRFTSSQPFVVDDSDGNDVEYGINGIVASKYQNCLATSDGTFKPISGFVLKTELTGEVSDILNDYNFMSQQDADSRYALAATADSLSAGMSKKQDKITVNEVDITDIETADITKLRTIVTNLINALNASGLIRETKTLE